MKSGFLLSIATLTMVFAFQNCGKVAFNDAAALSSSTIPDNGSTASTPTTTATNPVSTTTSTGDKGRGGSCGGSQGSRGGNGHSESGLVECAIGTTSLKITYGQKLAGTTDNSATTRVCMTQNACLNLINDYVAARGCSLSGGPATTSVTSQCTQAFPGQGVCNNAKSLTDVEVTEELVKLSSTN